MNRTNRRTAIILAITIFFSSISFSGCGEEPETISLGQWLVLVDQTFGMNSYQSDTPYFENISETDTYFDAVQIAAEWEVIDTEQPIDVEEILTWNTALITLVNVGSFLPVDTAEEDKIEYAIEHFDKSIRTYWMQRDIEASKAVALLGIAHEQWVGATYDHVIEEVTYKDDVVDLTKEEIKTDGYTVEDGIVKIPVSSGVELKAGEVYVLPVGENRFTVQAYKAENVYQDGEYIYIENSSDELTLEDVAEELFVEETYEPTMDRAIIYDAEGNIMSVGSELLSAFRTEDGDSGRFRLAGGKVQDCGLGILDNMKIKQTFTIEGYEITCEIVPDGKFDFKATVKSGNLLESEDKKLQDSQNAKLQGAISLGISELEITNKVDWGLFKGLKSASLKLNYKTQFSLGFELSGKLMDLVGAPYDNRNGGFPKNFINAPFKTRSDEGAKTIKWKTIKVASVDLFPKGVARVCIDINLVIGANGSVSVEVTESGVKGLEYKNHNLRVINESTKNTNAQAKGSIEMTLGAGPALYVFGLKKSIIGIQGMGGVRIEAKVTTHLADSEMHLIEEMSIEDIAPEIITTWTSAIITAEVPVIMQIAQERGGIYRNEGESVTLHWDLCVDITEYFVLKIELTDKSLVSDVLSGKITTKFESNVKLFSMHVDNGDWSSAWASKKTGWNTDSAACTLKYIPFDGEESAEKEEAAESEKVEIAADTGSDRHVTVEGDMIVLDSVMLTIMTEEKTGIAVTKIPEGYTWEDLQFKSGDEKIVLVDDAGNLTGVAEGSAIVTVSTKDGKYKSYCAVTVLADNTFEFSPIAI
ncbi:MAG: hypothetical protein NC541_13500 [bacterium]|nr:hypothetical protein [bacterium]MCM1499972.1 hypothetical protein [Clostridium sp.]